MGNFVAKGQYRASRGAEHGEPDVVNYSEKFNWTTNVIPMQKQVRHFVEKRLKSKDADFDSIKTLTITKA